MSEEGHLVLAKLNAEIHVDWIILCHLLEVHSGALL
jgi:hypothetical protein